MRWGIGLLVAVALFDPAAAPAATVSFAPSGFDPRQMRLHYAAASGETNTVEVSADATSYLFTDSTAPLAPGDGCTAIDAGTVRCDAPVATIAFTLDDGDDRLDVSDSVYPATLPPFLPFVVGSGGDGDDVLNGGVGPDSLDVGVGNDTASGGGGDDFLQSVFVEGPEQVDIPDGDDVMDGGPGNDNLLTGPGHDVADGGPGTDHVSGGPGHDRLSGGEGDDDTGTFLGGFVDGGPGDDIVDGGPGNDTVVGGPGADQVRGGDGDDRLELTVFTEDLTDDPYYSPGADSVDGGAGADTIHAAPSSSEPDALAGGDGVDTVTYGSRRAPVVVDLDGAADDGAAGEGDNVAVDVERLVGGVDSDTLVGGPGPNVLLGGAGDDLLDGAGGDDLLEGGVNDGGSDALTGGPGADVLRGGPGDDALDGGDGPDNLAGGGGSDTTNGGAANDTVAGGPGLDTLDGGTGDDVLRGGDVVLVGADGADRIDGGDGVDELLGGAGDDQLDGGAGADRFTGDTGRDTVSYASRGGEVSVTFDGAANDGEQGEGDRIGDDVEAAVGGAVRDTLAGNAGANALDGDSGEDYVDGGAGRDALEGGSARDTVRARDGSADLVACGESVDFAIADRLDTVRDCERVDRGGPRRRLPLSGAEVNPQRGSLRMRLPRTGRYVPLRDDVLVPQGTAIDTRDGRVRLAAAADRRGRRQAVTLYDGQFAVSEIVRGRPVTELALRGGDFDACPAAVDGRRASAAATRTVRRLWGRAGKTRGRFRTRGRWSTATVRGTVWLTEDRCDGTLTRVLEGEVEVHDLVRDVTVVLGPGERYLARAPEG